MTSHGGFFSLNVIGGRGLARVKQAFKFLHCPGAVVLRMIAGKGTRSINRHMSIVADEAIVAGRVQLTFWESLYSSLLPP